MSVESENSHLREDLLRQPALWSGADNYFSTNWQAREILADLQKDGVGIKLAQELALWLFRPLGRCEAEQKRIRGQNQEKLVHEFLVGCSSGIAICKPYTHLNHKDPDDRSIMKEAEDLIERISYLQDRFEGVWQRRKETFNRKRLGTSWNTSYGSLLRAHISLMTGWDDQKVLTAVVHLVRAMHLAARLRPSPDLRRLLQKAIRHFESDPQNTRTMKRLERLAASPAELNRIFRPVI
jgi:hypothetical protein